MAGASGGTYDTGKVTGCFEQNGRIPGGGYRFRQNRCRRACKGQTANFHLREEWDEDKILFYLNQYLPEDIAVCEVKRVDERFHSRYQAVEKTYLYRIHTGKIPEVFERRYVYDYTEPLDVNRMRKAAEYLCGTHDFKSFCGNKKMKKSTVRTISLIQIKELPGEIQIYYTGNGFYRIWCAF